MYPDDDFDLATLFTAEKVPDLFDVCADDQERTQDGFDEFDGSKTMDNDPDAF